MTPSVTRPLPALPTSWHRTLAFPESRAFGHSSGMLGSSACWEPRTRPKEAPPDRPAQSCALLPDLHFRYYAPRSAVHFKARLEAVQADSLREKKEKLALRQQLQEARQQLQQQAEYCTEMGAAACTLLWGVSSREEVVTAILGGDKALKFFSITGQTMESFVKSLDGDVREPDSDENQFVFALAGIVTNVAAIACGREFLVNSSRVLLDTMLQLLGDLKPGQCTKLKVLLLMALYNVSINLKGLRYISESPGFIPLLWWLLSGA
ncbi:heat shock factor 2-binding protein [Pteropus vampyrus]|uniref:Heat shock factor 2-binding protein n=1 Tax=Pteropus vampyrus TaxID=132908 RepID=A0A6P6BV17_PTEVA|nr:heat shock factor 2-binding protein [Pteropus vampyrus]